MKIKFYILVALVFATTSCASYFKRKECAAVNWFDYGQKVAEKGQNLENDIFIGECRKAEAEIGESALDQGFKKGRDWYCNPTGAFTTGKKGDVFSSAMCDGYNMKILKAKYNDGIKEYCQPTNGESVGASGQVYKNVCPQNLEAGFLVNYKVGRKKYLTATIAQKEDEVDQLEREARKLEMDRQDALEEARRAEARATEYVTETEIDAKTGRYRQVKKKQEDQMKKMEADQKRSDANSISYQIRQKQQQLGEVKKEIRTLKTELTTM